jgi:hypothetical protein
MFKCDTGTGGLCVFLQSCPREGDGKLYYYQNPLKFDNPIDVVGEG